VAHHADRAYRQKHGKRLRGLVVPARAFQLLDEDVVGPLQQADLGLVDRAEDAHPEAWSRERMPEHHLARQAEREAELAHLVLEQLAQWLEQLEVQGLGQAAYVVV